MSSFFKVQHRSKKSKARVAEIHTAHGVIQTPAFVPVATKGTIKSLEPSYIKDIGIQVAFVNTYHLVVHPGVEVITKAHGIQSFSQIHIPLMSDSGGFQVFSLGRDKKGATFWSDGERETKGRVAMPEEQTEALILKITPEGVTFRSTHDGSVIEFTPEKSIDFQRQIGADMIMAFDECPPYPITREYAQVSMERTHQWLKQCVQKMADIKKEHKDNTQQLFGIIQGATYEDLRRESAKFVVSQDTPGVAIGGVAVGESKTDMRNQVSWIADYLPADRPVHLLGIGHIDDIVDTIGYGIDSFDCVEPTRVARMGGIYQTAKVYEVIEKVMAGQSISSGFYKDDLVKGKYKTDLSKLDEQCECYVCQNFTKAFIHHLYKQKELLVYTLASYHNLYVMEKFMAKLRELIGQDKF